MVAWQPHFQRQATFTLLKWVELEQQRQYHYLFRFHFHLRRCIWLCVCSCASSHWLIVRERRTWSLDWCHGGRLRGYTGFPWKCHFHFYLPDLVLQLVVNFRAGDFRQVLPEAHWVHASVSSEPSSVPSIQPGCDCLYGSIAGEHREHRVQQDCCSYHGRIYCYLACCRDFAGGQTTRSLRLPQTRGILLFLVALTRGYCFLG